MPSLREGGTEDLEEDSRYNAWADRSLGRGKELQVGLSLKTQGGPQLNLSIEPPLFSFKPRELNKYFTEMSAMGGA